MFDVALEKTQIRILRSTQCNQFRIMSSQPILTLSAQEIGEDPGTATKISDRAPRFNPATRHASLDQIARCSRREYS